MYKVGKDTKTQMFSEISLQDGTSKVQILKTGQWKHPDYGEFAVTEEDLQDFEKNFKEDVRKIDLAVDVNHDPGHAAVGWFRDVMKEGTNLFALIERNKEGLELIKNKVYRYFSPELHFVFQDEATGSTIKNLLIGGGITNRPFFKGMEALIMCEPRKKNIYFFSENTMNFKELYQDYKNREFINAAELSAARLAFTEMPEKDQDKSHRLMGELEKKFSEEAPEEGDQGTDKEPETTPEEKKTDEEPKKNEEPKTEPETTPEEKKPEGATQYSESDTAKFNEMLKATTGMSVDEIKAFKSRVAKLENEKKFSEINTKLNSYVFNDSNKKGMILPKGKDAVAGFVSKLSDPLVKEFFEILTNFKTVDFSEKGGADPKGSKQFTVPAETPKGQERERFVLSEIANHFAETDNLDYEKALYKATEYIKTNNIK